MSTSFYTQKELLEIGFASVGEDVLISRKVSIYGASQIAIGNHVRIDDFTVLSGKITIGNYVHIAVFCAVFGGEEGIVFEDFSALSSRCTVYATTDDYSGEYMTNPTVPEKYLNIIQKKVIIGRYVDVGTGSTVLPGVTIAVGCSFGAMTLIAKDTKPWGFYMGYQCVRVKERSQRILELEQKLIAEEKAMKINK